MKDIPVDQVWLDSTVEQRNHFGNSYIGERIDYKFIKTNMASQKKSLWSLLIIIH